MMLQRAIFLQLYAGSRLFAIAPYDASFSGYAENAHILKLTIFGISADLHLSRGGQGALQSTGW